MREVENPMVIDSLWEELDQIDDMTREAKELEYDRKVEEMMLDDDAAYIMKYGWGRANGYHF